MSGNLFDLKKQLAFYGSYHNNNINVVIHTIFVPTLVFTAMVMLAGFGPIYNIEVPDCVENFIIINVSFVLLVVYCIYYVALALKEGATWSVFMVLMWLGSNYWISEQGMGAVKLAAVIHVVSWAFQFIGHGVFEGRKPALLDNLLQSLVLAPLFVWFHILFHFGMSSDIEKEINVLVEKNIAEWKKESKKKE
eukprot:TRINITY_DN15104_c0_g1_i1.p1 TRINITY_DN15104_c0_g1~~TRINITY_DN15104_c0_g1_i1.p1  ORF type:complete len:193 (-),score=44.61 TRINITY_DN15104_c0_g1_i1:152-730(-)